MFIKLQARIVRFFKTDTVAARYALDGLLALAAVNTATSINYLFALRLGAGDYHLSLVQFMPQILNLLILIPAGLFTDSLHNKRRMVTGSLAFGVLGYLLCSLSPFVNVFAAHYSIYFFLVFLSLTVGAMTLYNISWQSYFPDVVDADARNRVFTLRTQAGLFISMPIPLITGGILSRIASHSGKIIAHQGFYFTSALLLVLNIFNFRRFKAVRFPVPKRFSFIETKKAVQNLLHNKQFLLFAGAALFFHMTWQMDWTLYFIGQARYLKMNELQLGIVAVSSSIAQFLAMPFWSRKNEKYGVVLPVIFGIIGLSIYPLGMIAAVSMPASIGPHAFVLFHLIASILFTPIALNVFQCLLQVTDEEHRSFSISVYNCLICLSNAVMPVAGVALYHAFGADLNGLRHTFAIIFALRVIAMGLWILRWRTFKPRSN